MIDLDYLILSVSGKKFGLSIKSISEVSPGMEYKSMPGTHNYVMGIVENQGHMYTLIDLRKFISKFTNNTNKLGEIGEPKTSVEEAFIFVKHENKNFVLKVDEIHMVKSFEPSQLESLSFFEDVFSDVLIAATKIKDEVVWLLSVEALIAKHESLNHEVK